MILEEGFLWRLERTHTADGRPGWLGLGAGRRVGELEHENGQNAKYMYLKNGASAILNVFYTVHFIISHYIVHACCYMAHIVGSYAPRVDRIGTIIRFNFRVLIHNFTCDIYTHLDVFRI